MNKKAELTKFDLPIVIRYDNEYQEVLKNKLEQYKSIVQELRVSENCKNHVNSVCNMINEVLKEYYNGYTMNATQMLIEIISKHQNNAFLVSSIDNNYAFRGMAPPQIRPFENKIYEEMMNEPLYFFKARVSEKKLEKKDMFHIPYNQRGLISTQRFSMAGVPCMYFSTTSFGCWLELSMPEKEYFYCSAYKLPLEWKILNLCVHQSVIQNAMNFQDNPKFDEEDALIVFPLVIATSFRVLERNRSFKSEYIISQLLMQVCKILGLEGITYFSKKTNDITAIPQCINLAIICDMDTSHYHSIYSPKCKKIKLTEPVSFDFFIKKGILGKETKGLTLPIKQYKDSLGHGNISIMNTEIFTIHVHLQHMMNISFHRK